MYVEVIASYSCVVFETQNTVYIQNVDLVQTCMQAGSLLYYRSITTSSSSSLPFSFINKVDMRNVIYMNVAYNCRTVQKRTIYQLV